MTPNTHACVSNFRELESPREDVRLFGFFSRVQQHLDKELFEKLIVLLSPQYQRDCLKSWQSFPVSFQCCLPYFFPHFWIIPSIFKKCHSSFYNTIWKTHINCCRKVTSWWERCWRTSWAHSAGLLGVCALESHNFHYFQHCHPVLEGIHL